VGSGLYSGHVANRWCEVCRNWIWRDATSKRDWRRKWAGRVSIDRLIDGPCSCLEMPSPGPCPSMLSKSKALIGWGTLSSSSLELGT